MSHATEPNHRSLHSVAQVRKHVKILGDARREPQTKVESEIRSCRFLGDAALFQRLSYFPSPTVADLQL